MYNFKNNQIWNCNGKEDIFCESYPPFGFSKYKILDIYSHLILLAALLRLIGKVQNKLRKTDIYT